MKNFSVKTSMVVLVSVLLGLLLLSVVGTFIRLTAHQAQLDTLYTDRVSPLMQLQRVSHGYTAGVIDVGSSSICHLCAFNWHQVVGQDV